MRDVNADRVAALLRSEGFEVQRIPEAPSGKRADLVARYDQEDYIIEVKTKEDDAEFEAELASKGTATKGRQLVRSNTVQAIIRRATMQLRDTPASAAAFRLMVFVAAGLRQEAQLDELTSTLWGIAELLDLDGLEAGHNHTRRCYYFDRPVFPMFADLDAVLALWPNKDGEGKVGGRLHPNPWSPRAAAFRRSHMAQTMEAREALVDPSTEERNGKAFICDTDANGRGDDGSRLYFVQAKYGLPKLTRLTPHHFVAAMLAPKPGSIAGGRDSKELTTHAAGGIKESDLNEGLGQDPGNTQTDNLQNPEAGIYADPNNKKDPFK